MDVSGIERKFEVKDILKVTFSDEPEELRIARDRALAGQYEDGLEELAKINASAVATPAIKQDIDFYNALCKSQLALSAGGDKGAAATQMLGFLSANKTSFHFFEAVEVVGDLAVALGSYDKAALYYSQLAKAPWPDYQMKAAVLEGKALAAAGNYQEAGAKYQQVLNSGLNTPDAVEQKLHAQVGTAVCLAATGRHEDGIKMIESLIAKNDPTDMTLFGRAYNALGACYQKAGKTKDALLAYLHTDVLFYGGADAHAEALYNLSKLWAEVNKSDRAVRARSTLQERYPGSRWAGMP
jgi:tetratricopeptide (TPR) repeat protein